MIVYWLNWGLNKGEFMEYVIYTLLALSYLLPMVLCLLLVIRSCVIDKKNGYPLVILDLLPYLVFTFVPILNSHTAIELIRDY